MWKSLEASHLVTTTLYNVVVSANCNSHIKLRRCSYRTLEARVTALRADTSRIFGSLQSQQNDYFIFGHNQSAQLRAQRVTCFRKGVTVTTLISSKTISQHTRCLHNNAQNCTKELPLSVDADIASKILNSTAPDDSMINLVASVAPIDAPSCLSYAANADGHSSRARDSDEPPAVTEPHYEHSLLHL
ncbi:hypothetical protein GQ600_26019 [Phytophthora cactorum]|nr:hypothetical protein GQ600_26019 [Phytophthora cactorum]